MPQNHIKHILTTLAILVCFTATAQYDIGRALSISDKALKFMQQFELDSANYFRKKAHKAFRENDDLANYLELYRQLGHNLRDNMEFEEAMVYYKIALNSIWRMPESKEEFTRLAWTYASVGYIYGRLNDQRSKVIWYKKATKIFIDKIDANDEDAAYFIYSELGNALNRLRDYDEAESILTLRKNILEDNNNWKSLGTAYNDLALVFRNKDNYDQAIELCREALGLDLPGSNRQASRLNSLSIEGASLLFANLVEVYILNGEPEKAFYFNKRFEDYIREQIPGDNQSKYLSLLNANYGDFYQSTGAFDQALIHYKKAIEYSLVYNPGDHRTLSQLYILRANLYQDRGEPIHAITDYYTALQHFFPYVDRSGPEFQLSNEYLPSPEQLYQEPNLIETFGGLARSYIQADQQNKNLDYIEKATRCFELASQVEDLLLKLYVMEGSALSALHEHRWIKEEAIALLYRMWENESSGQGERAGEFGNALFDFSEKNRAHLLLKELNYSQAINSEEVEAMRSEYIKINNDIQEINEEIGRLADTSREQQDSLNLELTSKNNERNSLYNSMSVLIPGMSQKQGEVSLQDFQNILAPDEVVIEYFLGEQSLFIFRITKNDFHPFRIDRPPDLYHIIKNLRKTIYDRRKNRLDVFCNISTQLYDWLLRDALAGLPDDARLIVIPDGELAYIPFEVLLDKPVTQTKTTYKDLPYLIKSHAISYASSAALLLRQKAIPSGKAEKLFAGFAPTYDAKLDQVKDTTRRQVIEALETRDKGIYALEGAIKEVNRVSDLLRGSRFLNDKATKQHFLDVAGDYNILLLSMHSIVGLQDADSTRLLFTIVDTTNNKANELNLTELTQLRLQADLVFLSACNTGFGRVRTGEGVMSLSRAFFASGVPSTVMSLWKIPDDQTSDIVSRFFKCLKEGYSKDKALQKIKIDYINTADNIEANPYFWAGLVAAGDTTPIELKNNLPTVWWLAGLLLFVFVFLYYKYFLK